MISLEQKAVMTVAANVLHKELAHEENESKEILLREGDKELEAREELLGNIGLNIAHLAGTIFQSEKERLQRLIFRATRGTALTYFQDIEQPFIDYKGAKFYKTVYIVIYQEGEYFTEKLNTIIASFLGNSFEIGKHLVYKPK